MIFASGKNTFLRDGLSTDVDHFIHWQTHGEWRFLDAPWEGVKESLPEDQESQMRERFLDVFGAEQSTPRKRAILATQENRPLGWVNRYKQDRFPDAWYVGIDICEDDCLGQGFGTEALLLWVGYLFENSTIHRIGLDTWSFNPRMIHVAKKIGLVYEGAQREILCWKEEWLDFFHFGITREEWARKEE